MTCRTPLTLRCLAGRVAQGPEGAEQRPVETPAAPQSILTDLARNGDHEVALGESTRVQATALPDPKPLSNSITVRGWRLRTPEGQTLYVTRVEENRRSRRAGRPKAEPSSVRRPSSDSATSKPNAVTPAASDSGADVAGDQGDALYAEFRRQLRTLLSNGPVRPKRIEEALGLIPLQASQVAGTNGARRGNRTRFQKSGDVRTDTEDAAVMTTLAPSHMEALKSFLLGLRATGGDGFEGLMAKVLTDITGISFRLAASGSQFGSDGSAVREEDGVSFECKRYKDRIPRSEILSKIAELSLSSAIVDAWFLCATSEVSAQIARDVRKHGREFGIGTIVLDWAGGLPRLAVAVAMSTHATRHSFGADASGSAAVQAVRATGDFNACAEELRRDLREPLVGTEVARRANGAWLTAAFSSREKATLVFGEPLSPLDEAHGPARPRAGLIAEIRPFLTGDACQHDPVRPRWRGSGEVLVGCAFLVTPRPKALDGRTESQGLPGLSLGPTTATAARFQTSRPGWRPRERPRRGRLAPETEPLAQR